MHAVKLALALLLLKSELILPFSRLSEWLQVLEVWCFRLLNNYCYLCCINPDFWSWCSRLVSMFALFLRVSHSGGSFGPSLVGNVSHGSWWCRWGLDVAILVFLYRESEWGGKNWPSSIFNGLELVEHTPSSMPFQVLRSWECCCGCTLRILWHHGKYHILCEMRTVMFAASAWSRLDNSGKLYDSSWLQVGLVTCAMKIKCHCENLL